MDRETLPIISLFPGGFMPTPNTWFLGPTRVHAPNGIFIGLADLMLCDYICYILNILQHVF